MHREHRRREPRAGHLQSPQQQHDPGMQQQINGVITERRQPPQFMLQPEGGIQQRPIVGFVWKHRTRGKPDLRQPRPGVKRPGIGQYQLVIPHESGRQRRKVTDRHQQAQRRACQCHRGHRENAGRGGCHRNRRLARRPIAVRWRWRPHAGGLLSRRARVSLSRHIMLPLSATAGALLSFQRRRPFGVIQCVGFHAGWRSRWWSSRRDSSARCAAHVFNTNALFRMEMLQNRQQSLIGTG